LSTSYIGLVPCTSFKERPIERIHASNGVPISTRFFSPSSLAHITDVKKEDDPEQSEGGIGCDGGDDLRWNGGWLMETA